MELIYNAIRTPDGTVIVSRSRHDYRTHTDANGKEYMVDGGFDYCRSTVHADQEWLGVYSNNIHEKKRTVMEWGTYGPKGDQPLKYVKLMDMSLDHIQAILDNVPNIRPAFKECFEAELEYR